MKIDKLTITYGVKRSQNYQSVDVSMTTEVTLGEGDTPETAFKETMQTMNRMVDPEADAAIRDIVRISNGL